MTGTWRDTLYVWDGILTVEKAEKEGDPIPLKWEGTWVSCEDCADAKKAEAPKRGAFEEFVESDMRFEVEGKARSMEGEEKDSEGSPGPYQASIVDGPGWDLGEGSEKKKHKDTEHELFMKSLRWTGNLRDQTVNIIFALGKNEHGPFISAGWMRPGNRLTLGRRYLDKDDARAKWDLEDLRNAVRGEICQEGKKVRIPPWQCDALHSEDQSGKKRKVDVPESKDAAADAPEEKAVSGESAKEE